jgi:hypothetical protein
MRPIVVVAHLLVNPEMPPLLKVAPGALANVTTQTLLISPVHAH